MSRTSLGNSNRCFSLEMAPKKIAAAKEDKVVKPSGKKEGKRKAEAAPEGAPAPKAKAAPGGQEVVVVGANPAPGNKPVPLDRKAVSGMLTALKYAADPFFDRPGRKEAQQALEALNLL